MNMNVVYPFFATISKHWPSWKSRWRSNGLRMAVSPGKNSSESRDWYMSLHLPYKSTKCRWYIDGMGIGKWTNCLGKLHFFIFFHGSPSVYPSKWCFIGVRTIEKCNMEPPKKDRSTLLQFCCIRHSAWTKGQLMEVQSGQPNSIANYVWKPTVYGYVI